MAISKPMEIIRVGVFTENMKLMDFIKATGGPTSLPTLPPSKLFKNPSERQLPPERSPRTLRTPTSLNSLQPSISKLYFLLTLLKQTLIFTGGSKAGNDSKIYWVIQYDRQ